MIVRHIFQSYLIVLRPYASGASRCGLERSASESQRWPGPPGGVLIWKPEAGHRAHYPWPGQRNPPVIIGFYKLEAREGQPGTLGQRLRFKTSI